MAKKTSNIRKWKVNRLKDHPRQHELFDDVSEAELRALADHMRDEGQLDAVEVLPDGTVITGHQRVRAARLLGWKEVDVIVRHDLAEAGEAAVEKRLIDDNFVRRQLSPLARARCIARQMEIEEGAQAGRFGGSQKETLKARIAKLMNLSARSVNRYLLILQTPPAVQQAFDSGRLTLIAAGRVALLDAPLQAEIASRIESGEVPARIVSDCFTRNGGGVGDETRRAVGRLLSALRRDLPYLSGRISEVRPNQLSSSVNVLRDAKGVFAKLIQQAERKRL